MHERRKGILLIVGAALLWSTGGIGIKAVADSALKVAFYRSLFAAVALAGRIDGTPASPPAGL